MAIASPPPVEATPLSPPPSAGGDAELAVKLARYPRQRVIDDVRRLSTVNNWHSIWVIASTWAIILGAATLAVWSGRWWVYVLAAIVIGSRQQALGVLVHDATHYLLFTNRRLNDLVSDVFLAFPVGMSTTLYRRTHWEHHRYTNTEHDPDWVLQQADEDFRFPKSIREAVALLARSVSGLNLHRMAKVVKQWSPGAHLFDPLSKDFPLANRILFVVVGIAIYSVLIVTGWWLPAIFLYALPALTVFHALNRLRVTAEHIVTPGTHELNASRTVVATPLERWLIAPCGVHYHLEHHLFPSVPCHRLAELHQVLMRDPEFRQWAHITPSYFGWRRGLVAELLGRRPAPERD